jgi:hypothetical protein
VFGFFFFFLLDYGAASMLFYCWFCLVSQVAKKNKLWTLVAFLPVACLALIYIKWSYVKRMWQGI